MRLSKAWAPGVEIVSWGGSWIRWSHLLGVDPEARRWGTEQRAVWVAASAGMWIPHQTRGEMGPVFILCTPLAFSQLCYIARPGPAASQENHRIHGL